MKSILLSIHLLVLFSCSGKQVTTVPELPKTIDSIEKTNAMTTDTATFGGGCFWCIEAVFQQLDGVVSVASGYSGGQRPNPSYEQVCSGATGHAEVVQVVYHPEVLTYDELLEVFWSIHDPTTPNRQGADVGTQYRSVIYYHSPEQQQKAGTYKSKLNADDVFGAPVVTEISPMKEFYNAEKYHQNYYNDNENQPYCSYVIRPKLEKFKKVFSDKLKK
jgi:peptide-methionine (S)-S-oxide reductase